MRRRRPTEVSEPEPAVQLRAAHRNEAVFCHGQAIRLGRSNVRVELRREQLHLAPVHHRGAGRVGGELSVGLVGLPGRPGRHDQHGQSATAYPGGYEVSLLGSRPRWATKLDSAGISWGFYTATVNGDLGIWSAYQAIKHIYYGADWKKTSSRRKRRSSPTSRTEICARSAGSRRRGRTPTTRAAARIPAPHGSRRWSTRSANPNTGIRLRSSSFGTITAAGTIPEPPALRRL